MSQVASKKVSSAASGTVQLTLANVAEQWKGASAGAGVILWRFAQTLLRFTVANPKVKQKEIGESLAKQVGRANPYSNSWVSRALNAARAFPTEPASAVDAAKFTETFYGNGKAAEKTAAKSAKGTAEDALRGACSFARAAVKRGMDPQAVVDGIVKALNEGEDESAE